LIFAGRVVIAISWDLAVHSADFLFCVGVWRGWHLVFFFFFSSLLPHSPLLWCLRCVCVLLVIDVLSLVTAGISDQKQKEKKSDGSQSSEARRNK
jgi:hypothetical protein